MRRREATLRDECLQTVGMTSPDRLSGLATKGGNQARAKALLRYHSVVVAAQMGER